MNKLSKAKRNQLILVVLVSLAAVSAVWMLLVNAQRQKLTEISEKMEAAELRQKKMQTAVDTAREIEVEMNVTSNALARIEGGMAHGDLYSWLFNTIESFKQNFRVDIPQYSQVERGDTTLFPKFPYRQAKVGIGGTAYFSDLGKFLAEFENQFPYMRVQNLELYPSPASAGDKEKLTFRMEIIALVKPDAG